MTTPVDTSLVPVTLVEGEPFLAQVTVETAAAIWGNDYQVYGQVRQAPGLPVLLDLAHLLTAVPDETSPTDLIVELRLSGRQTRDISALLGYVSAVYDVFIAEAGAEEARSARIMRGPVTIDRSVSDGPP